MRDLTQNAEIMKTPSTQIPFSRQLINHFYVGIAITLFYLWVSPRIIAAGYPGLYVLLLAELLILLPLVSFHLIWSSKKLYGQFRFSQVIPFTEKLPWKTFLIWAIGGIIACFLIYIPMYPLGLFFRESLFSWLPEWYFNPSFGAASTKSLANAFLIAIAIDGILGPVAEELFFRGYLLPRMAYLKKWAPVVNGVLFGLYHFWQPHNLVALIAIGIILSYLVWKKRNVYLGIAIHCAINLAGAVFGYLAVMNGTMIGR